jgi:hypothetical protein
MKKVDLKKELRHLYSPSAKKVQTLEVPEMTFLMMNGQGDPKRALTINWDGRSQFLIIEM